MLSLDTVASGGLAVHAAAFALPLVLSFALARAGQARAAWMLPGGLFLMGALFVGLGLAMSADLGTAMGAVATIVTLAGAGVAGGVAGALLGRGRR